jgi:hypothetical protein
MCKRMCKFAIFACRPAPLRLALSEWAVYGPHFRKSGFLVWWRILRRSQHIAAFVPGQLTVILVRDHESITIHSRAATPRPSRFTSGRWNSQFDPAPTWSRLRHRRLADTQHISGRALTSLVGRSQDPYARWAGSDSLQILTPGPSRTARTTIRGPTPRLRPNTTTLLLVSGTILSSRCADLVSGIIVRARESKPGHHRDGRVPIQLSFSFGSPLPVVIRLRKLSLI